MRCPRCNFENMPGRERCFRCETLLSAAGGVITVEPLRMARWKRPARLLGRKTRGLLHIEGLGIRLPKLPDGALGALAGFFLSVIPGLGHLVQWQLRKIRLIWPCWLLVSLAALFFWGSAPGIAFFSIAVVLHAWIALQAGVYRALGGIGYRLMAVLFFSALLARGYYSLSMYLLRDYPRGFSSLSIPGKNVRSGDLLVGRFYTPGQPIHRGDLLLARIKTVQISDYYERQSIPSDRETTVQVIALPQETMRIREGQFRVDLAAEPNHPLDPVRYPLPELFPQNFEVTLGEDQYFVAVQYEKSGYGQQYRHFKFNDDLLKACCIISGRDIRERYFLRWNPVSRRGFLPEYE